MLVRIDFLFLFEFMKIFHISFICLLLSIGSTFGQELTLKLLPDSNPGPEKDYVFSKVIDSRVQKSIGLIYDSDRNKHAASFGGNLGKQSLAFYTSKITPSKKPSYAIQVKIYNLDLKEIYMTNVRGYKGDIQLSLGFFLITEMETVPLVDFNSKAEYGRPANQMNNVETAIQKLFDNSWIYFDSWLSSQYQINRALVKKVRVNILEPKRPSSKDTVFYDPERPLTWDDFREMPNPKSSYNATIFSSIAIEGTATVQNGEIVQNIEIKVYMLPGQSWVKSADDYANNHEQRHFDLTRIAADRMIYRLKNTELEPNLYEAKLNDIYLDGYREMNHLQEVYDNETRNGINKDAQARWNQLIEEALSGNWQKLGRFLETKD
jgi:hypothetical protein